MARGKEEVKERRLLSMDAIRYQMMHCVRESLQIADNWKDFQENLANAGIHCRFRFNLHTSAIEGISFTIAKDKVKDKKSNRKMQHDISFSGKQLDPSLTLANLCEKLGNPVAIAHAQAKDMYEDVRKDWYDAHTSRECQNIDDLFPDFDSAFPRQANALLKETPDMEGSGEPIPVTIIEGLYNMAEDIANAGNGCIYVGLQTLAALLFVPYQPSLSVGGGGGSSSKMGWGDDDKYKKRYAFARNRHIHGGCHR